MTFVSLYGYASKSTAVNILCTQKGILDAGTIGKANEFAAEGGTNEQELQAACREYDYPIEALRDNGTLLEGAVRYDLLS
jgi:hypothetical protein